MAILSQQEDDTNIHLPSVQDFSFDGILKAVNPEGMFTVLLLGKCVLNPR
jgi:hypothetical protein